MNLAVGIDPSATSTGVAWHNGTATVATEGPGDQTPSDWAWRIIEIRDRVLELVHLQAPKLVVVERPAWAFGHIRYFHERAGVYWAIVCALQEAGFSVATVSPNALKSFATGKGNAKKKAVVDAIRAAFPRETIKNDDEADAKGLCAIGCQWLGVNIGKFSELNRELLGDPPWKLANGEKAKPKKASKPRKPRKKKSPELDLTDPLFGC